ncbi:MAG: LPS export ABC transporter permease LptF [Steroidobacteraceae bacterium]
MASILSRYILRETVVAWLAVTGILLVILLTNQIAGVLERAAESGFPRSVVMTLVGLGLLQNAVLVLPIGILLGVMLALGRLYHDGEMTAAVACGADPRVWYRPVLGFALLIALLVGWISLIGSPAATERVQQLRSSAAQAGEFAPLAPGAFRSFGGGSTVLYVARADEDGTLREVFLKRSRGERYEIAVAARARHEISADGSLHTLTLYDGERYEGVPGSAEYRRVRFAENVIPVRVPELALVGASIEAKPTLSLWGSSNPEEHAELHYRLALPIMALVLGWLSVPLSRLRPRQGRYSRVWLAIVVYFVYLSLINAARVWLGKGLYPSALGLWWVHAAVVLLTMIILMSPSWLARWRWRERLLVS